MGKPVHGASSSLLAAQQRLQELRNKRRAERIDSGLPVVTDKHGRFPQPVFNVQHSVIDELPAHLGWGSAAVTAVLCSRGTREQGRRGDRAPINLHTCQTIDSETCKLTNPQPRQPAGSPTCKLYPDIALGMLRQELAAAGRIWLLLSHIDNEGRGWQTFEAAREKLTEQDSDLFVCGKRQLRNLLNHGDGVFWVRRNGRIWLRSVAKVAASLGVRRLKMQPVSLPLPVLLGGIGQVRAHLYASFHSSRGKSDSAASASPIARATVARISHVPRRTQRFYEQRAKVKTSRNFAIGPQANDAELESQAWQRGTAVFPLNDQDGWHGRKKRTYLAWQLPNNYAGPHAKQPRGRMKRINQELADLFMKGMTGNGGELVEDKQLSRRFFGNGRLAAQAFNQTANQDIYWKKTRQLRQSRPSSCQIWYVLSKHPKK